MALTQHHVSSRMLPGLLSVILALAAAAESTAEPSLFVCPKINATRACACRSREVTCNGLRVSDLSFVASSSSVSAIETLSASHNDLRELPADFLPGATSLIELTLSHNKIASIDGHFFESLPSLVYLDLSYNKLAEFYLPQNVLPNLEILNLTNNFLSHLRFDADRPDKTRPPEKINRNNICGFGGFSYDGLEQLYLSHNKIENDLNFLHNLTKLTILTLGFNNISKIDPNVLPCSPKLRCLYVNNNQLSDLTFLKCAEYLDKLNVSSNVISTIPENTFTDMIILRNLDIANNIIANSRFLHNVSPNTISFLDLSRNKLSKIPANNMMDKSDLKYVDVSYNELTDISFAGYLEKLEVLLADNNNISQINESMFLKLRGNVIKHLSLSNNFISNIAFLKQLKNITSLDLNNNKISRIEQDTMSQLKKLVELDLSNNRINDVNFVNEVPSLGLLNLSNNDVTQLPCNNFVQIVSLDENKIRSLKLNCAPNLRYLYVHGGMFRDRRDQELQISKEVLLDINNKTITFPCFPTLEVILRCKETCSSTEAYTILCEAQGTVFSSPIAIVIYCIGVLLCLLVICFIIAKCYRPRRTRVDSNRECLCGKGGSMHRHHPFTRNELCW